MHTNSAAIEQPYELAFAGVQGLATAFAAVCGQ